MWHTLNESLSNICASPFWDTNLTWYSADPDFTICFEKTILVWLPCTFLWLFSLLEIYFLRSTKKPLKIHLNWYNVCKLVTISILGTTSLIDMANYALFDGKHVLVDIIAPTSKFFTFILFFGLTYANIESGIRSSGILFIFSLLLALCSVVQFRTDLKSKWNSDVDDSHERTINAILNIFLFYIYHFGTLLVFLLNCFADPFPPAKAKLCKEDICPESGSSILSKISFSWFDSMVWKGYKRPLKAGDVWEVDDELKTQQISSRFEKRWNLALRRSRMKSEGKQPDVRREEKKLLKDGIDPGKSGITKKTSILRPLCETFGPRMIMESVWYFMFIIFNFLSPVVLKLIIGFAENKNEYLWRGILYVFLLLITVTSQSLFINQNAHMLCRSGLQIRTALQSIIYKKALRISNGGRKEFTFGEMSNLITVDTQRFFDFIIFSSMLWTFPLVVLIGLYFLWELLGLSVLASMAMLATLILASYILASKLKNKRVIQMKYKDERIKLINEIISGIRVLKLNAWEPSFEKQISRVRRKETAILKSVAYLQTVSHFISTASPFLVFFVTFGVYTLSSDSNVMDARTVFVSLAVFNILRAPLARFPVLMEFLMQAIVSMKRIDKYLNAEDLAQDAVSHEACDDPVLIKNGQFSWDDYEASSQVLSNINLRVKSGDLVAVVGPVGSGKSSLLAAILGEMYKQFGSVNTTGKLAYVPQQAWIRNTTLRDNVTFEGEINHSFYAKILEACALNADLKTLPGGDQAEIGEKGINLSGGQKQRVSLARAIYANTDVYLLDDPLSAVDSHVGKHIFQEVIGPHGMLKNKTRIWVTHNLNYLPQVDNIIVLQNGTISETGTYKELLDRKGDFANFLATYHTEEDNTTSAPKEIHNIAQATNTKPENAVKVGEAVGQKLIEDEKSKQAMKVYKHYLKAIGVFLLIVTLSSNVMYQIFSIGTNYWLSVWTNDHTMIGNNQEKSNKQYMYLGVYAFFGFLEALSVTIMSISVYVGLLKATNNTHNSSLSAVLRWPTTIFDKIPLGRIINRFSFDMDVLDTLLPQKVVQSLIHTAMILTALSVISYSTPFSIIVIAPLAALYFFVQRFFIVTSRQLKRIESVSKSPIYSHMQETVIGAQSIRAYGLQSEFTKLLENKIDFNQKCTYASIVSRRWLAVRMELMSNMIVFSSALFAVLARDFLSAGLIGLSLTYALQITFRMFLWMQIWCELETNIVAIERLQEYSDVEQEAAWEVSQENIPNDWPSRGKIAFEDFQVRYQKGLELVLKGISFSVESGEKIGIVGRTGSGKSSLTLSLFRIIESAGGKILIDDVDISKIGLHTLRGRLTIIAQDPVLFAGTLRINLDPTEEHTDKNLWKALELANLKTFVSTLNFGLQHEVTEGGSNFSVGQRQLICLARAVLRKTKLLVLDEATAAVDMETDDLIQTTIRHEFKDCTILTIAHRLNTVLDYDRIIVLDDGRIVEFDSPNTLLSTKESLFYKMAADAGIVS